MPADPKSWPSRQPAAVRERVFRSQCRRKYGLTPEEYRARFAAGTGRCEICDQKIEIHQGSGRSASLDHDHATGKLRGFLCNNCNLGLGAFQDAVDFLKAAILYLEKHA